METPAQPVRRRPKDRKQQILEQAVGLFIDRGFHSVKLEDIAEAAGVTARALYRHYDNKQALLAEAIRTGQDQYQSARRLTDGEAVPTPRPLNVDLPDLIAAAVASRSLTVLWQREARYLNENDRAEVRRRINAIVAGMRESVLLEVPGLSPQHSELRAWAVSSTLTSLGRHNLTLGADELNERLYRACMAAARTPPVCELPPLDAVRDEEGVLFSRYETLLAAGARLFRAQGYPAVSTSEIGKGAGIAGPGLYRSFSSKQAILDALIRRLDEWWSLECIRAIHATSEAVQRLHRLVEGHVRISLDAPDLVAVSVTELSHASDEVRDGYLRNQADREAVWIDLIRKVVPETTAAEARLLVAAAISFIEDVARTWHLTRYAGVADEITAIALSILTSRSESSRAH
ncbi:TetR/AcrR family transcriptional regulator [Mycobacterium nebraskense]|uniref:TetR family transcriptional regulator n=1 Tax=Mycobacterium nebraskense TaxID=244292 RepID=A0A0F5NFF1_9MYCO|nr:TetR/AcrR family transcriptional regulator [Mycobacterium nebraskense]KKC05660.1 TetR family transcriptional regulator [Mycobacterium nebraskense]KLO39824.1 TetR family transcriptional regulator [Mycobacterium nebraskense]MBI2693589.1 TetR/AcrR family transcriptional regulator [Mycobacterium nebraskense]MCV7116911.1 TetR/AcrR family transcriptional regulator [Mycobacterium nebraskense]ORW24775.1 TetR family transcriptional regulator [Mycobacterium nebraskense]